MRTANPPANQHVACSPEAACLARRARVWPPATVARRRDHRQEAQHRGLPRYGRGEQARQKVGLCRPLPVPIDADQDDRKGPSFLSRFIGSSKKKSTLDGASDQGSDAGDRRPEGMDAQLYMDNVAFHPKMPPPPAYIKVRAKFKKEKEFDRLFLAQELQAGSDKRTAPVAGMNPAPQSGAAAKQNPVWAIEFSKDGKYLAAGGQDRIVRVWAVLATAADRQSHDHHEANHHATAGEGIRLSAPVFRQQTVREYHGHTSTILDLSWSKVSRRTRLAGPCLRDRD